MKRGVKLRGGMAKYMFCGTVFLLALMLLPAIYGPAPATTSTAPIDYHAVVCKKVIRADGTVEDLGCDHNVITNVGLDHIKYLLGTGITSEACKYIALGNGTAPTSTSTSLDAEITVCGLTRTAGSYTSNGVGNWTISNTWTSTCDGIAVNTTALFNATSAGTMFAGDSFTTSTLNTNDQIQVSWTIWVQSA